MSAWKSSTTAPWFTIPSREFVNVEHPCVVQNVDRAIESLQRGSGIAEVACTTVHTILPTPLLITFSLDPGPHEARCQRDSVLESR